MSKAEELANKADVFSYDIQAHHISDALADEVSEVLKEAAAHLRALEANRQMLVEALTQAIDDLQEWGCYVPDYFKEKHKFKDDVNAARAALEQAKDLE